MLLFTEDAAQPWTQPLAQGFAEVASRHVPGPILYHEYLDIARFHDDRDLTAFRDWLVSKYRQRDVDVVVPLGEPAMDFIANNRQTLWPAASVYFLATHQPDAERRTRLAGASGLVMEDNLGPTLEVLERLLPGMTRVELLRGLSPSDREFTHTVPAVVENAGLGYAVLDALTLPEALTRVATLPPGTLLLLGGLLVDSRGRVTLAPSLCAQISEASNAPVIMLGAQNMGCGILGGVLRDFRTVGRHLADGALKPPPPGTVAVLPREAFTSTVFDARQLERWRIPERRLPPGSTVLFRRPNLWRDYPNQVLLALGAIVTQFALIAGLLYHRRHRRRAEEASRRNLALAARASRLIAMGELTASIAHELALPLGAILHNVEAARLMLASNPAGGAELSEIVGDIAQQDLRARDILTRIRTLAQKQTLDRSSVDLNSVVDESVRLLAHEALARGVQVEQKPAGVPCVVMGDRVHLQQVVLNLILNAMEAMSATPSGHRWVVISTAADARGVTVSIKDTGSGLDAGVAARLFDPFVTTKPQGLGIGLSIARSIVTAHGGRIEIENDTGGGAIARMWLPSNAAAA